MLIAGKGSESQFHTVMIAMPLIRSNKVVGHAEKLAFQTSPASKTYHTDGATKTKQKMLQ